jgi:hypothetical protein
VRDVRLVGGLLFLTALTALACAKAGGVLPYQTQVSDETQAASVPTGAPSLIYVSEFELDLPPPSESGTGVPPGRGPVRSAIAELRGDGDPAAKARELVALMQQTIVEDLTAKGLAAQRLPAGAGLPTEGWLVRGVFTQLDEGQRATKAVIGMGAGASELDLYVNLADLAKTPVQPFYSFDAENTSGKLPGAAVMKFNPYVAAAKFVMSRNAGEREVKATASKIAEKVAARAGK